MKKIKVTVTTVYEIEVDEENEIVREYDDERELIEDLVHYGFDYYTPVIFKGGVTVLDQSTEDIEWDTM